MTSADINYANFAAFVARAINRASVTAVDAEFGLRVCDVSIDIRGDVRIELDNGHLIMLYIQHLVPCSLTPAPAPSEGVRP